MAGTGNQHPMVCALVLNHNGAHFLRPCLGSLLANDYPNLQVYLVDNGSTDDSLALVRSHFPTVRVIPFSENLGYSAAYNRATRIAQGDYYFFLNNDVTLESDVVSRLVATAQSDSEIAAVTPKMLFYDDRQLINACGGNMDRFAFGLNVGIGEIDRGQYDQPREVFYAVGAAMLVKATAWEQVEGFDERFFAYYEDSDWSWRARLLGLRVMYVPAVLYHKWRGTWVDSRRRMYLQERNRMMSFLKNHSTRTLAYLLPLYSALAVLRFVWVSIRWGPRIGWSMIAGDVANIRHWRSTLNARAQIQRRRVVDDAQILKAMAPGSLELKNHRHPFLVENRSPIAR